MSEKTKAWIVAFLITAAATYPAIAAEDAPESSSVAVQEALVPTPVGQVPPQTTAPENALQELTEGTPELEETLEEVRFPSESSNDTDPEPVVVDDPVMDKETQEVEEFLEAEPEPEEKPWYLRIKDYLSAHISEGKARAVVEIEKRKADMKYGEGSSEEPNFSVIQEAEAALAEAEEVRQQRELDLEVERQNKLKLYNESLMCLALNGYYEARGETADQEVASGAVVLNRLSVGFRGATTICEVVYTPKQFSWVDTHGTAVPNFENSSERKAWERSVLIAKRLLDSDATYIDPTNGAVYYYNPSIVKWKYAKYYIETAILGNHRFMREKKGHQYYIDNSQVRINPVLFNGLSHEEREQLKKDYQDSRGN